MYEPVTDQNVTTIRTPLPKYGRNGHHDRYSLDESYMNGFVERTKDLLPPEKPPRKNKKQQIYDVEYKHKMRTSDDSCIDIENVNFRPKLVDSTAQTSLLVPYRLRFWPRLHCDVKLGPSESTCSKLRFFCICRILSQWFLSQFGLTLIIILWALIGAYGFFITEGPRERAQTEDITKIQHDISQDLTDKLSKLKSSDQWSTTINMYLEKHGSLLLEAVSAGYGEGGGGSIWTYPGCILFSVSLLTTLGFGAPVPRTPQGRGAAVLFAAIGIPLHFLLILNMGNLMAIKLQQWAYHSQTVDFPSTNPPKWLKWFPVISIASYYLLGVVFFGFVRLRAPVDSFMFPLDFTAAGGVATVQGHVRILYAIYLEIAVTLAALVVSLIQASTTRGLVDICLKLGLLTNT